MKHINALCGHNIEPLCVKETGMYTFSPANGSLLFLLKGLYCKYIYIYFFGLPAHIRYLYIV
jgi:hypothetical protein